MTFVCWSITWPGRDAGLGLLSRPIKRDADSYLCPSFEDFYLYSSDVRGLLSILLLAPYPELEIYGLGLTHTAPSSQRAFVLRH